MQFNSLVRSLLPSGHRPSVTCLPSNSTQCTLRQQLMQQWLTGFLGYKSKAVAHRLSALPLRGSQEIVDKRSVFQLLFHVGSPRMFTYTVPTRRLWHAPLEHNINSLLPKPNHRSVRNKPNKANRAACTMGTTSLTTRQRRHGPWWATTSAM